MNNEEYYNDNEPLGGYQGISEEELLRNGGYSQPNGGQMPNQNPVEPEERQKMSMMKVGLILVAIIVALILGLTLMSRISVKKQNTGNNVEKTEQDSGTRQTPYEEAKNILETQQKNVENNPENGESTSSSAENTNSAESQTVEKEIGTLEVEKAEQPEEQQVVPGENGVMSETLQEPALGEVKEASVIVSSKNIYTVDDSAYSYSLTLLMLSETEAEEYTTIKYFCSRKTFDNVQKGDNLRMQYQVDQGGLVSPLGITK